VSSAQTSLEVLTKIYECLVLVSLEALLTNVGLVRSRYVKIFSILLEDLDTALEPVAFFKYN
jgi:peptidoglycan hydrolase CwlO-like protein